jgi:hypothetical protein
MYPKVGAESDQAKMGSSLLMAKEDPNEKIGSKRTNKPKPHHAPA